MRIPALTDAQVEQIQSRYTRDCAKHTFGKRYRACMENGAQYLADVAAQNGLTARTVAREVWRHLTLVGQPLARIDDASFIFAAAVELLEPSEDAG